MAYNNYSVKRLHAYPPPSFFDKFLEFVLFVTTCLTVLLIIPFLDDLATKNSVSQTKPIQAPVPQERFDYSWSAEAWLYDR